MLRIISTNHDQYFKVRPADDKLTSGHEGGYPHWGCAGRGVGAETVAVRRLLQGCRASQQDGEQRFGWVGHLLGCIKMNFES